MGRGVLSRVNKLTGIVIAKNEERKIADCLSSLSFCDEIIVIDSGSSDHTGEIAVRNHAKVYKHPSDDFSALRNFALTKASSEWIVYIDADERVSKELAQNITDVVHAESPFVAFRINRKNFYFGKYAWPAIEHLERLFLTKKLTGWYGKLHESPRVTGDIGQLEGFLVHYSHDDLSSMLKKTNVWSDVEAKMRLEANHPRMTWWRFPRVMMTGFCNSYFIQ